MTTFRRLAFASVLTVLLVGVAAASAAGGLRLALRGGHGTRSAVICGVPHRYTRYRRGESVRFTGTVPGASGTTVRIKVKQCANGQYVTLFETHVRTTRGAFSGSFRAPGRGVYSIRAYDGEQKSGKVYFQVA